MSKSVSDQKVEDVLSSVRRLVSSELPRKPRPTVPEGPGALVLTEAHRVEKAAKLNSSKGSLEDRIAELEAAVGGQPDEFEPDGSEDQAQHRPDRIVYTRPPNSAEEAAMRGSTVRLSQIALIETGPANDDDGESAGSGDVPTFRRESQAKAPVDPQTAPSAETNVTVEPSEGDAPENEAPMAVDVPSQPRQSAEVRAFTDPDDVVRNIEARIASGRPISEPLPLENPVKPADNGADDFDSALVEAVAASVASSTADQEVEDESSSEDTSDHASDVLKAEEFNPSIFSNDKLDPHVTAAELLADTDDVPVKDSAPVRPEPVSFAEIAPKTVQPEPEAKAASVPEPDPEPQDEPTAMGEAIAALAALPEEEAMRLLISRMIRDELQGELGERITRNVRKLVRREVQRALTSKDLT